jgi:GTP-binding protein EngB required for normal cell division
LGQFKSGKSSFINSIIGEDILPVGVIPVTSIITRLQYGAAFETRVHFLDGKFSDISIDEIEHFITEEHNPKNVRDVSLVDIYVPQLSSFPNIRIVDTPGVGSFFKHNTETTNQWLPEIGVALIAVSVEIPLSEDDILLIKNIKKHAAQTDIIITKSDLVTANQLQQILNYMHKVLADENLNNYLLLPYSTTTETVARVNEIKEKVLSPLSENFTEKVHDIFRHKFNTLRESCFSYLRLGLESTKKRGNGKENLILTEAQLVAMERRKETIETYGEIETEHPGYLGAQDTYYVGNLKGVGRIYQQTFIDTYAKVVHVKLYDRKNALVAADLLNDRVIPFYEAHGIPLLRILTDRGTEYCGRPKYHEYELYLAVENIDHSKTKARHPQTNGICERFHKTILNEFYQVAFRKKIYNTLEELQTDVDLWIKSYNEERPHTGNHCDGKTPMETFLQTKNLAEDKMLGRDLAA